MILDVYCRRALLDAPPPRRPALLLEGRWPEPEASDACWALDEVLDGRFLWIDREASRLAEQVAADSVVEPAASIARAVAPAWLNGRELRSYLAKLLRVIVFFSEVQPLRPGDLLHLVARQNRDEDDFQLLGQLCELAGATCQVRWTGRGPARSEPVVSDERWQRWATWLSTWLNPRIRRGDLRPRLVLCGEPRRLDPVCREALAHGSAVWWLSDRVTTKTWLHQRRQGVGQLVCNASQGHQNRLRHRLAVPCHYRGVDLSGLVSLWMERRLKLDGARQTQLLEQIGRHLNRVQPEAIVLDEDATPMARAVVAAARRQGILSLVLPPEAPIERFGFAPQAADRLLTPEISLRTLGATGVSPVRPGPRTQALESMCSATMLAPDFCEPPSPPAPLPQAGEGSQEASPSIASPYFRRDPSHASWPRKRGLATQPKTLNPKP